MCHKAFSGEKYPKMNYDDSLQNPFSFAWINNKFGE